MIKNSFHKTERLKSRKSIESLFKDGYRQKAHPFILLYREVEGAGSPALMTVAVPKKLVNKAVDRNLVKRRTREAYRLLKQELYASLVSDQRQVELLFLYQSGKIETYELISNAVRTLLTGITESRQA